MHCSSRSIIGGLLSATTQRSATLPPGFLIPAFSSASQTASFSSSTTCAARKDGNPARGISAIRRTGLNKKIKLSVDLKDLPKPVLDPARHSSVQVDEDHGLWGFFNNDRTPLQTPEQLHAHGRGWTVQELRSKSWDDLHRLWWMCIKDTNRCMTNEAERQRLDAGYGEYEFDQRMEEIRKTQKAIKICLTERWYSWEEARVAAMEDEEVDLFADTESGQPAYLPKEYTEDAFGPTSTTPTSQDAPDATAYENMAAKTARQESSKLPRTVNLTHISPASANSNTTDAIKLANDSVPDRAFTEAFNELNKYYADDELDTCVEKARELLQDSALPRYHRIRTLILLGSVVEDWREARCYCTEAHTLWRFVRHLHPAGENEKNDASMEELCDYILELRGVIDKEQAKAGDGKDVDYDDEAAIEADSVEYEAQLAEDKALAEAENDDPEALLAADPKVLGTTTGALRNLDITESYVPVPPRDTSEDAAPPMSEHTPEHRSPPSASTSSTAEPDSKMDEGTG